MNERAAEQAAREEVQARMDPAELAFRLAWRQWRRRNEPWTHGDTDDLERPLFITVTPGAYMDPACITLAISGTPPRGMFVITTNLSNTAYWRVYILHGDRPKVIDADRPQSGLVLRRAILNLIEARGIIPAWKAEMPWQKRYPEGEPEKGAK